MRKVISNTVLTAFFILSTGCVVALVGAGAAGVYAISDDSVEAIVKTAPGYTYQKALKVMKSQGTVSKADSTAWHIEGRVDDATTNVWVSFDPKTGKGSKITVKARKFGGTFPKIDVAKKVLNEILRKL